jgi:hypothetical protein
MATEPDATLLAQDDPAAFYVPLAHGGAAASSAAAAADAGGVLRLWGQGAAFEGYEGFLKSLKSAGGWLVIHKFWQGGWLGFGGLVQVLMHSVIGALDVRTTALVTLGDSNCLTYVFAAAVVCPADKPVLVPGHHRAHVKVRCPSFPCCTMLFRRLVCVGKDRIHQVGSVWLY